MCDQKSLAPQGSAWEPEMLWCHPCAWTAPAATGSGAKATQPSVTVHSSIRHWPWQVVGHNPGRSRQRGMHNSWIFAARWASIMHWIKIQMLEHEAGNSKKQHGQSKCQRNENMSKTVTEHSATFHVTSSIISHRRFQILGKRLQKYSKIQYLYFEC